jgi:hypothetical protein
MDSSLFASLAEIGAVKKFSQACQTGFYQPENNRMGKSRRLHSIFYAYATFS